jgi:hypothetical protein
VLFADVLEHRPDPQATLLVARDLLNPHGAVIVSVPNVAHWSVRVDLLRGRFQYQPVGIMDATHLRWFTATTARTLLASVGFKVIKYRPTAGVDLPDNQHRRPWRWLSYGPRVHLLRALCHRWPSLFGCQHVFKAEVL